MLNNIRDSYNAVTESRKLVMAYASITAATIVAFVYVKMIPDIEDFLSYMPEPSDVDPGVVVSVYNKHVDAIDSVMVNLFLLAGGIIAAYMSVNVWQKFTPGHGEGNHFHFRRANIKEDDTDPEQIPDEV